MLANVIFCVLDHHTVHQPYISFQLYQVNYIDDDSKKQNKTKQKDWFYFDLLFCQNPDIFDDITIKHLCEQFFFLPGKIGCIILLPKSKVTTSN
jgi:hypothetical protein